MKYFALFLLASGVAAADESRDFAANEITSISIDNGAGYITAIGVEGNKVAVKASHEKGDTNCKLFTEVRDHRLSVKPDPKARECELNLDIAFPPSLKIEAVAGSGAISIGNVRADVVANAGSGAIIIAGEPGHVAAKTGSGAIDIKGLRGDAKLRTGSGDMRVIYQYPPRAGAQLDLGAGSGSAEVVLPQGATAKAHYASASGSVDNKKPAKDGDASALQVSFAASSGDLRIK